MRRSRGFVADVMVLAFVVVAAGVAGGRAAAVSAKKGIDPEADRILKQMTDYLAGLRSFTVRTSVADELTMKSGEKIQMMSNADIAVERPNRLRSLQYGSPQGLGFWYDGKMMSVACKANNSYRSAAAPPTIDMVIDMMRKDFDVDAPGADLIHSHPYDVLMEQVVGGRFIGRETVDGVPVNHIALQGDEVDLQLWIQDAPEPLPLRYVIVTKDAPGRPAFSVQLSNWDTKPHLSPSTFEYTATPQAKRGEAIAASCGRTH